jgi:hypothetical protein
LEARRCVGRARRQTSGRHRHAGKFRDYSLKLSRIVWDPSRLEGTGGDNV